MARDDGAYTIPLRASERAHKLCRPIAPHLCGAAAKSIFVRAVLRAMIGGLAAAAAVAAAIVRAPTDRAY